ncbi:MAG: hypothetical protein JJU11_10750 [Candidatus Sumerlaeia bacterium]|nr:hypothetical protein [Candidatus Sumerlaeia bacterium]
MNKELGICAVYVDGNSISGVSARKKEGKVEVIAATHRDSAEFHEMNRRKHHPIFMDVDSSVYKRRESLIEAISSIVREIGPGLPVIGVLAPEKLFHHERTGENSEKARHHRLLSLLREYRPVNPFDYPSTLFIEETAVPETNESRTAINRIRLTDLLPLDQVISQCCDNYVGLIPAQTAVTAAVRPVWEFRPPAPLTICDVGKLRTIYSTILPDGKPIHHSIPVGLARDDKYYFESFTPTREAISALARELGKLFLPAEATPLPLTTNFMRAPQFDLTRMALQVSRYAVRSLEYSLEAWKEDGTFPGAHFISGGGSRVPGLRQYIEEKTHTPLRRFDRRPIPGITLAEGLKWADISDSIFSLGACMSLLNDGPSPKLISMKPSLGDLPLKMCTVSKLVQRRLYVLEQTTQLN